MSTAEVRGHILITDEIEEAFIVLQAELKPLRCVGFIREDFLIEDAKAAIAEAYISEEQTKYVVLGAKSFNAVSQNALLKVLEEPPRNIEFIVIAPSKSLFLPTIRSRLPIKSSQQHSVPTGVELHLSRLDLAALFDFLKTHSRVARHEAKVLIESIYHQAVFNEKMILTKRQMEAFERAYKLLELNGRLQTILLHLLMSFIPEPRRAA